MTLTQVIVVWVVFVLLPVFFVYLWRTVARTDQP